MQGMKEKDTGQDHKVKQILNRLKSGKPVPEAEMQAYIDNLPPLTVEEKIKVRVLIT